MTRVWPEPERYRALGLTIRGGRCSRGEASGLCRAFSPKASNRHCVGTPIARPLTRDRRGGRPLRPKARASAMKEIQIRRKENPNPMEGKSKLGEGNPNSDFLTFFHKINRLRR